MACFNINYLVWLLSPAFSLPSLPNLYDPHCRARKRGGGEEEVVGHGPERILREVNSHDYDSSP